MAGVFTDIELEWGGRVWTIKAHRVMGALARIEQHITLAELQDYSQRGTAPLVRLSMAYGDALRYAGARVSDDDIYEQALNGGDAQDTVMQAVMMLMQMMLPASARAKVQELLASGSEDAPVSEDTDLGNSQAAAPDGSKRRSNSAAGRAKKAARA